MTLLKNETRIVNVSIKNLFQFLITVRNVFYYVTPFEGKKYIFLSIFPIFMQKIFHYFSSVDYAKYYILVDSQNKIIGTTGLYHIKKDPRDILWLGWFCVMPEKRKLGFGKELIEFTITEAVRYNANKIKLFTSDHKEEQNAQYFYEKYEFFVVGYEKQKDELTVIYREKNIKKCGPINL
jgi:GNAT superfamily N-acetyltransferase